MDKCVWCGEGVVAYSVRHDGKTVRWGDGDGGVVTKDRVAVVAGSSIMRCGEAAAASRRRVSSAGNAELQLARSGREGRPSANRANRPRNQNIVAMNLFRAVVYEVKGISFDSLLCNVKKSQKGR